MNPKNFIGMSDVQVENFLKTVVNPILENNNVSDEKPEINV